MSDSVDCAGAGCKWLDALLIRVMCVWLSSAEVHPTQQGLNAVQRLQPSLFFFFFQM
jgi:hypothetical protein